MPLLKFGKAVGRGMERMATSAGGIAALGIGAGILGLANSIGPKVVDFAMEGAFGDENTDRYFTGMDLSARTLIGQATGGFIGGAIRATDPMQQYAMNPILPSPIASGLGTATLGIGVGAAATKIFNKIRPVQKSAIKGGFTGALLGGIVGVGAAGYGVISYMKHNKE